MTVTVKNSGVVLKSGSVETVRAFVAQVPFLKEGLESLLNNTDSAVKSYNYENGWSIHKN